MAAVDVFTTSYRDLEKTTANPALLPVRLATACAHSLPAAGAGISIFGDHDFRIPVGASDPVAAIAERLQFTMAEGPCIDAHATAKPLVATETYIAYRWPAYYDQLVARTPFRAVAAIPLRGAFSGIGALDLFFHRAVDAAELNWFDVHTIADLISTILVEQGSLDPETGPSWLHSPATRLRDDVYIAMGMVNVAMELTSQEALAVLRARAFATGRSVDDVAHDVATGQSSADLDVATDS